MASTDFTIADVLAWARTKPADESYNFISPRNCAVAQFGRATGREYLIGRGDLAPFVGEGDALIAIALSSTFGELVGGLERVVEPSTLKRVWAKLTGKTIGKPVARPATEASPVSDTWTRLDAYMVESVPA
jgi:hypothetical protein